ncbi:penicillin-binding protein 1A [Nitrococcus mobilis]|uniref:Penicillin-binding protein 1A n=1 Tax=Nitrococcus mobilis Nb-231 TaxID=314278 RepID=A4BQU3_9GAMM|nr:penicillin-binding protein 1A [Nitrococcus mobilis]EAR21943.1 Penicillin-binding protein 1A [Nitrococcus mobilis Nb-231]
MLPLTMKRLLRISAYLLVSLSLLILLLGCFAAGVGYLALAPSLPSVKTLKDVDFQVPLRIFTADGTLIAAYGAKKRLPLHYDDLPEDLINAVIAAEDQRFFEHPGVDYQGILRAVWYLVRTGEKGPGGSTITMQVARNFFLTRERSFIRKAKEILLALRIDRDLSKQEILELYLNKIYLGHHAYGVGAAAEIYYGKSPSDLTLAQLAMIAGLPKAPSAFNPITDENRALIRRSYVLGRMRAMGFIDAARYRQAMAAPITAKLHGADYEVEAHYLAEMVRAVVTERFGEEAAYSKGYRVYTTVQSKPQQIALRALRKALYQYNERHGYRGPVDRIALGKAWVPPNWRELLAGYPEVADLHNALVLGVDKSGVKLVSEDRAEPWRLSWDGIRWAARDRGANQNGHLAVTTEVLERGDIIRVRVTDAGPRLAEVPEVQGALLSIAPSDGRIIALVGGYDFGLSKFNRVTQAQRQPGSSFKPFIYSAALHAGFTPATLINDAPVVFKDSTLEDTWRPQNYSGRFFGPTRLREALVHSRNLVSIRILQQVGIAPTIKYLQRFGFTPEELPRNLSLALGSANVTALELARGYAVFANGGFRIQPYFIQRIVDDNGQVLFEAHPAVACSDCIEPQSRPTANAAPGVALPIAAAAAHGARKHSAPRVISAENAYLLTTMLQDVIRRGTGRKALALDRSDLAGKTGTTNDQRDAWFSGFNPTLVTTAWIGFDRLRPLGYNETGAKAALPMWMAYMEGALQGVPEQPLVQPSGLVTVRIDSRTGLVTTSGNPDAMFETFRAGRIPARESQTIGGATGGDRTPPSTQSLF